MTETIYARMKQIRDLKANWDTINPILLEGELGIELDSGKMKIGDGFTAWLDLEYVGGVTLAQNWVGLKTYLKDEMIYYNGLLYRAIADFTSTDTFVPANWEVMSSATLDPLSTLILNAASGTHDYIVLQEGGTDKWKVGTDGSGGLSLQLLEAALSATFRDDAGKAILALAASTLIIGATDKPINPVINGSLLTIGYDGVGGNTRMGFYDDNSNEVRELRWNNDENQFEYEDNTGSFSPFGGSGGSGGAWERVYSGSGPYVPFATVAPTVGYEYLVAHVRPSSGLETLFGHFQILSTDMQNGTGAFAGSRGLTHSIDTGQFSFMSWSDSEWRHSGSDIDRPIREIWRRPIPLA